jgi:hypothetical protein
MAGRGDGRQRAGTGSSWARHDPACRPRGNAVRAARQRAQDEAPGGAPRAVPAAACAALSPRGRRPRAGLSSSGPSTSGPSTAQPSGRRPARRDGQAAHGLGALAAHARRRVRSGPRQPRRHRPPPRRHAAPPARGRCAAAGCAAHGIEHRRTTPSHPWSRGQAERMSRTPPDAPGRRRQVLPRQRCHRGSHGQRRARLAAVPAADNRARPGSRR